tara:strand:- start:13897 stop:15114 length:1218 start_codon:yes stop_codon:yes gene_type:complete
MKGVFSISGEKILMLGLFLTPFTSLRFGFAGPGEILILFATMIAIFSGGFLIRVDSRLRIFYYFWIIFLTVSILGLYFNNFFSYIPSGTVESMVFDLFSYIFIILTIVVIGHYASQNDDFSVTFFKRLFIYWGFAYVVLFAISFITPSIFGMPLRYHEYFSPLVKNIHQASMVTAAMSFVMLYLGIKSQSILSKLLFFVATVLFAVMALTSGSTKAMLGIVVGALICVIHFIGYRPTGRGRVFINMTTFFITFAFLLVFLFLYTDELIFLAVQFFTENDGADGSRQKIYLTGFLNGLNSPLIGFGPGAHVPYKGGFWDAHNSTLTIFLQAGFIGVLTFIWFNMRILMKLSINFALFGAIAAIGMYIIGGDILRRLPIWIILVGLYYFSLYQPWSSRTKNISSKSF